MDKFWSILFGVVIAFAGGLFVVAPMAGWWLPIDVSTYGGGIDALFYVILAITGFFFLLTEGILIYNMFAFTADAERKPPFVHGHHKLEVLWTAVPAVILLVLAFAQVPVWNTVKLGMPKPGKDVLQINVSARQWEWRVSYPSPKTLASWDTDTKAAELYARQSSDPFNRFKDADMVHGVNEIHVWKGGKVLVFLRTRDVIHSFFLPNLRQKQDALPGKVIPLWFEPTDYNTVYDENTGRWVDGYDPKTRETAEYDSETGRWSHTDRIWDLACAEYCGTRHSMMRGKLFVHENKADFMKWLKQAQKDQNERTLPEKAKASKP